MSSYMVFKVTTVVRDWVFCLISIQYLGFLPRFYVSMPSGVSITLVISGERTYGPTGGGRPPLLTGFY